MSPPDSSDLPVLSPYGRSGQLHSGLLGLASDGVCRASSVTTGAVGAYSTFSPLPRNTGCGAVYFLWHFPWRPRIIITSSVIAFPNCPFQLGSILPFEARTFLPAPDGAERLSDHPGNIINCQLYLSIVKKMSIT